MNNSRCRQQHGRARTLLRGLHTVPRYGVSSDIIIYDIIIPSNQSIECLLSHYSPSAPGFFLETMMFSRTAILSYPVWDLIVVSRGWLRRCTGTVDLSVR